MRRISQGRLREAVEHRIMAEERRDRLGNVLNLLPERSRTAFLMRHVDGADMDTIASAIGSSVPTAQKRISNARLALRDWLRNTEV